MSFGESDGDHLGVFDLDGNIETLPFTPWIETFNRTPNNAPPTPNNAPPTGNITGNGTSMFI